MEKNINPDDPLQPPIGRSGRRETAQQPYGIDAANEFDQVFNDIYDYCEKQYLDVNTLIHEAGAGQMEINFTHGDPLNLADQVFFFKRVVRETALRHNMYATFMAKPMEAQPGSAMHIHQSVLDANTGENVFVKANGSFSDNLLHYIAGLQTNIPATMPFLAPNVNSYRRIAKYTSAPINTDWGIDNRTVGFRVPKDSSINTRVESRIAGADANPYLALAATLACGLIGIEQKLVPKSEQKGSAYNQPISLPRNLEEALCYLDDCEPLREKLGAYFIELYKAVKRTEYNTFSDVISSWEREFLLLSV